MPTVVDIRVLGPRLITTNGEPWRFVAPPRTMPLLGYLVTAPGVVSREQVAAALWPDLDDEEARANLRRHLHRLQQALPRSATPWVSSGPDGLRWTGTASVDVVDFERAHAAGDCARAIECYGGDFLDGYYDDWIIAQRERLANLYLSDLNGLLAEARSKRDHAAAIAVAQRILQIDEWREDAMRALMAVRYETGDRAGALGTFERFARKLADEMRVEPMPETLALRDAILRNGPVSIAADDRAALGTAVSDAVPLVGRAGELARLRSLWDSVSRRGGGVAFVSGEAGIGKTRLVHEFALEVERQGGRVLVGSTAQQEAAPYEAFAEALRAAAVYFEQAQIDPLWLRVLADIVPEFQSDRSQAVSIEAIGGNQERTRLFEAMRRALAALGKTRPFLMVLEDLHWAGSESADALQYIARHFTGICGVVLATYRDDEYPHCAYLERVRRALERERRAIHVQPARLSTQSIEKLLQHLPNMNDGDRSQLARSLHRVSDGNPLFVLQLLRDFAETGRMEATAQPPGGMAATIASRVARLPENSRLLAEHAAVAGRTFSVDLLRDATGWSEDEVLAALSELIDRHFMRACSQGSLYHYGFAHNLLQLAIYEQIPARVRERLHHRMAAICERGEAENPALCGESAQHWDRAGEAVRAACAYVRAADHAFAVYANETARQHAHRALDLGASGKMRFRALRQLVAADERTGDKQAWQDDIEALLDATTEANLDERFDALACAARRLGAAGERHAHRSVLEEMKHLATQSGNRAQLAETLIDEGTMLWRCGEAFAAQDILRNALDAAREASNPKLERQARMSFLHALMYAGEVDRALAEIAAIEEQLGPDCAVLERMALMRAKANAAIVREDGLAIERVASELVQLTRRVGDLHGEAEADRFLAYAAAYNGLNLEKMRAHWSAAAEKFDRAGARQPYCAALLDLASIEVELGRYEEADRRLGEILPLARQLEWPGGIAIGMLNRAELQRCSGEYGEARESAIQALEYAERIQDPRIRSTALNVLGSIECALRDYESGLAHLRQGVELRRSTKADWSLAADLCRLIEALLAGAEIDAAREAAEELERTYRTEPQRQMNPEHICWTLARVRRACGDGAGFREFVKRGRTILAERCAALADPDIRHAFGNRPFCRELLAADADTPAAAG